MGESDRDEKGHFKEGHAPSNNGKGGRPPKAREAALLAVAYEIVNADAWRQIIRRRVLDAVGKKQITTKPITDKDGRIIKPGESTIVDDERSTAQGRNLAAAFLRDTLIGRPTEYVRLDGGDESAYEQFSAYTDEQIAEILAAIERLRRDSGGGGDAPVGTGEAGGST
jgi:hypothetical protein